MRGPQQNQSPSNRRILLWSVLCFVLAAVVAAGLMVHAQQRSAPPPPPIRPSGPNFDPLDMPPTYTGDPMREKAEARRIQYLNMERQKTLVADTNKLVKLASDLNALVNGEQHGQLTPDQVRQLNDIEKLAKTIREKMSTSIAPAPSFDSQPLILPPR